MLDKFRGMRGSTKALVIACAVLGVITIGLVVAVLITGGFTNPF